MVKTHGLFHPASQRVAHLLFDSRRTSSLFSSSFCFLWHLNLHHGLFTLRFVYNPFKKKHMMNISDKPDHTKVNPPLTHTLSLDFGPEMTLPTMPADLSNYDHSLGFKKIINFTKTRSGIKTPSVNDLANRGTAHFCHYLGLSPRCIR
jgi:hypothetical protein